MLTIVAGQMDRAACAGTRTKERLRRSAEPAARWRAPALALCLLLLAGCAALTRQDAVPQAVQERATVHGLAGVRYWPDQDQAEFVADAEAALEREQAFWRAVRT